jgi:hypothetical protein
MIWANASVNNPRINKPGWLSRYNDGLRARRQEFDSRQVQESLLYSTEYRPAKRPTRPPTQWVRKPISLGVKRPGLEVVHSPPSSAEVKNGGATPPLSRRERTEDSQSHQAVKYGHESREVGNQESLCWRGPAAI